MHIGYLSGTAPVGYTADGETVGEREVTIRLILAVSISSLPAPKVISQPSGSPISVGDSKDGDWNAAVPALEGVKIEYYSLDEGKNVILDLGTLSGIKKTPGQIITITGSDYTLTITSTKLHDTKSDNIWVMASGTLYVTVATIAGYVRQTTKSRSTTLTYTFTASSKSDEPITFTKYFSKQSSTTDGSVTYNYNKLINGTLTEVTGGGGGCFATGTLITLADGSQKTIESLTGDERILAWDFENGCLVETGISAVTNHGVSKYDLVKLTFSNGNVINMIEKHSFYDCDESRFVTLDADNSYDYIGHRFIALDMNGEIENVTLVDINCSVIEDNSYSIFSDKYVNAFAGSVLSLSPSALFLYPFEITGDMKFDIESMKTDIAQYGLMTYEEFSSFGIQFPEDQFYALNGQYIKIAVAKGIASIEEILEYASILMSDTVS
ncbi:MAG: hypothetical protein MJ137_09345 [Clostridia bacterium]|nr:hypothetical protein [Clostridia bacterium]